MALPSEMPLSPSVPAGCAANVALQTGYLLTRVHGISSTSDMDGNAATARNTKVIISKKAFCKKHRQLFDVQSWPLPTPRIRHRKSLHAPKPYVRPNRASGGDMGVLRVAPSFQDNQG